MPQLARWFTFIEELDYEVVHRDGRKHSNADGLSRRAGSLAVSYEAASESDSESTSSEQLVMVFHDTVTEQDEAISCEQFEFREQIPSARPLREPDKEQAKTELETSVMESLAARQQSDPEIGKLVQLRLQSQKQPALALLATVSESAKRLCNQWERLEVREGSYDEEPKESLASNLIRSSSFPVSQSNTCSALVTKERREGTLAYNARSTKSNDEFYWLTWKEDTIRFCKRCDPCNEYHRGKLRYSLLSLALPTSGGISI